MTFAPLAAERQAVGPRKPTVTNRIRSFELFVLRPIRVALVLGGIVAAISGRWWWVALCVISCLYVGAVGAKIHPLQSASDLAKGPLNTPAATREAEALPDEIVTWLLSLAITKVAMLVSLIVGILLAFEAGWKWYVAAPVALVLLFVVGVFLKTMFHAIRPESPGLP